MESRPDMLPVGQRMGAPESDNLPAQVLRIDAVEHPTAADWMHPLSVCQPVPPPHFCHTCIPLPKSFSTKSHLNFQILVVLMFREDVTCNLAIRIRALSQLSSWARQVDQGAGHLWSPHWAG